MTNYYINTRELGIAGPYDSLVKARAAAIRQIKKGDRTYYTAGGYPTVAISTNKAFKGTPGAFFPQVVKMNGVYRWNTWDFGNLSNMPVLNADGTIRRR